MRIPVTSPIIHPIIVPTDSTLQSYNFYLVQNQNKIFLVDAGIDTEECWEYFIEGLQRAHIDLHEIDAIVLTHNHADHIGLVNRLRQHKRLPVYAHQDAKIRLKRDSTFLTFRLRFFEKLYNQMGCGPEANQQIEKLENAINENKSQRIKGDICPIHEEETIFGFKIIEVLGHSPDHIALYHKESGILFAGDHILEHSSSNALIELGKDGKRSPSLCMYEASLDKIASMDVKIIYTGHGRTIMYPDKIIDQKLARIEKRANRVMEYLKTEKTAAELAKSIYKERYYSLFPLVMSEIIGHLDRLERMECVQKRERNGIYYYSTV